jgi:hypothetical protein
MYTQLSPTEIVENMLEIVQTNMRKNYMRTRRLLKSFEKDIKQSDINPRILCIKFEELLEVLDVDVAEIFKKHPSLTSEYF